MEMSDEEFNMIIKKNKNMRRWKRKCEECKQEIRTNKKNYETKWCKFKDLNFCFRFCIDKMYLISAERYIYAGVCFLTLFRMVVVVVVGGGGAQKALPLPVFPL